MTDDRATGDGHGPGRFRPDGGHRDEPDVDDGDAEPAGGAGDGDGTVGRDPTAALSPDELAGVVDLFGLLTPEELRQAAAELAFRRGDDGDVSDPGDRDGATPNAADDEGPADGGVEAAVDSYHLVEFERDGETYLAVGPVAFPSLPADAEDLPHILDVPERSVDRAALATDVEGRLRGDAARAAAADDEERMRHLLDVTYDLETWAPVEVEDVRDRLDAALQA